jgi:hypothetical protein
MDVWVEGQGVGPCVEHRNRARDRSQPALANGVESAEGSLEKEPVALSSVRQKEGMESRRNNKDRWK